MSHAIVDCKVPGVWDNVQRNSASEQCSSTNTLPSLPHAKPCQQKQSCIFLLSVGLTHPCRIAILPLVQRRQETGLQQGPWEDQSVPYSSSLQQAHSAYSLSMLTPVGCCRRCTHASCGRNCTLAFLFFAGSSICLCILYTVDLRSAVGVCVSVGFPVCPCCFQPLSVTSLCSICFSCCCCFLFGLFPG